MSTRDINDSPLFRARRLDRIREQLRDRLAQHRQLSFETWLVVDEVEVLVDLADVAEAFVLAKTQTERDEAAAKLAACFNQQAPLPT